MGITPAAEAVRVALYRHLADTGTLPDDSILTSAATGRALPELLDELEDARHIVRRDGRVVLAHPFATRNFRFSVMSASTLWWGGCAWDAFAIPHLVPGASNALVATTCPACDAPHAWTVSTETPPPGSQVAHFLVPGAQIWDDVVHSCENQLIFCDEHCVASWLGRTGEPRGYVMNLETLWRLASHWYEGRLDTPYTRREPMAAAEYFRGAGLHGAFWGQPD
ncbi:organomercurial lyase [Herbiconiux sp. VKM Ac-2851]|uniref:organomercurial lyase n=1 Tax=Herbiconiux sp. VKM Ac-2851 TaxID=2739025 RepID=UPI0015650211|nr:organomercurial lyase [Herbiconiux sp. VKM Ac-2851]NQX33366.1 hypothetical protein [Herbiconiux sp. VKM Ac-2851]